jgi:autotransporter family porin
MRLHDRLGETQYLDDMSGNGKVSSMWMRNIGGHTGSHVGNDAIATNANRYVIQIGGDIVDWSNDGLDRYLVGLIGGYANQKSHSVSRFRLQLSRQPERLQRRGLWYLVCQRHHQTRYLR